MLEINSVTKIYGRGSASVTALSNVSLKVEKGVLASWDPPSGKSTSLSSGTGPSFERTGDFGRQRMDNLSRFAGKFPPGQNQLRVSAVPSCRR
jgi:ABC-type lipoprotein export system ATPase subunit